MTYIYKFQKKIVARGEITLVWKRWKGRWVAWGATAILLVIHKNSQDFVFLFLAFYMLYTLTNSIHYQFAWLIMCLGLVGLPVHPLPKVNILNCLAIILQNLLLKWHTFYRNIWN